MRRLKVLLFGSSPIESTKKHAAADETAPMKIVATVVGSQPAFWKSAGNASMPGPVTLFATSTTCETKKIPAGRSASERAPAAVEKGGEKESAIVVVDTTTPDDETTKDETATL